MWEMCSCVVDVVLDVCRRAVGQTAGRGCVYMRVKVGKRGPEISWIFLSISNKPMASLYL